MVISDEEVSSPTRSYHPSTHIQGALDKMIHVRYNIINVSVDIVETPKSEKIFRTETKPYVVKEANGAEKPNHMDPLATKRQHNQIKRHHVVVFFAYSMQVAPRERMKAGRRHMREGSRAT